MPNMVVVSEEVPEDRADAGASWQRDSDHVFTKFSVSRLIGSGEFGRNTTQYCTFLPGQNPYQRVQNLRGFL